MQRPTEKYSLGIHHLAQPTMDPEATLNFYVDTMGATITHCIASKGWRPGHYDYIHMFLDLGKNGSGSYPDNIAMFYYFGAKDPSDWPRYGTHHSFGAKSIDELDEWEAWLTNKGHKIIWRAQYEIMTSLYVWDPNGRFLEIAAQHRPLNDIDADDAKLTAQALILAANEQAGSIERMWEHKANLIEARDGTIGDVALICRSHGVRPTRRGRICCGWAGPSAGQLHDHRSRRRIRNPATRGFSRGNLVGCGHRGIKGHVSAFDEKHLVITCNEPDGR